MRKRKEHIAKEARLGVHGMLVSKLHEFGFHFVTVRCSKKIVSSEVRTRPSLWKRDYVYFIRQGLCLFHKTNNRKIEERKYTYNELNIKIFISRKTDFL